jgi:four helix bundle protein
MTDRSQDIRDRTFEFACRIARLALRLEPQYRIRSIVDQFLRSGTSIGANLEEAKAGSSRRDFVKYLEIALREARETVYWLRICLELKIASGDELESLRNEGEQIGRILGAIVSNAKRRMALRTTAFWAAFAFFLLHFAF